MSVAISVSGLHKTYGDFEAVRGIDFEVATGEVFGLLGPNGAGKTTTVEILEGIRQRTSGDVRVLDFDPDKQKTQPQGPHRRLPPGHQPARQAQGHRSPAALRRALHAHA